MLYVPKRFVTGGPHSSAKTSHSLSEFLSGLLEVPCVRHENFNTQISRFDFVLAF